MIFHSRTRAGNNRIVLLLGFGLALALQGCGAREADFFKDPEGINRSAKPQVIMKGSDVILDGKLIQRYQTRPAELVPLIGRDITEQKDSDAYWDTTGIQIHATNDNVTRGAPVLIHRVVIWLGQENDINPAKRRSCNEDELREHQESIHERIQSITQNDLKHGWGERTEEKEQLRNEQCSKPGKKPEHAFSGYLEVDGMPIGPNMTLAEIQARRQKKGLLPLIENSSPQLYTAPKSNTGPFADQTWIFDVMTGDKGRVVDQRLKAISIP